MNRADHMHQHKFRNTNHNKKYTFNLHENTYKRRLKSELYEHVSIQTTKCTFMAETYTFYRMLVLAWMMKYWKLIYQILRNGKKVDQRMCQGPGILVTYLEFCNCPTGEEVTKQLYYMIFTSACTVE